MKIEILKKKDWPDWIYNKDLIERLNILKDEIYVLQSSKELGPCSLRIKEHKTYPTNCRFVQRPIENGNKRCMMCFFNKNNLNNVKEYMDKYVYSK